jgi:hypothetical protein
MLRSVLSHGSSVTILSREETKAMGEKKGKSHAPEERSRGEEH